MPHSVRPNGVWRHTGKGIRAMPYVRVEITRGATRDQKKQLVGDITDSLVGRLGKKPEHIHIVIDEVDEDNWGFAGMLTTDWRKQQS
nr:4-oxalocrotonate tautomerase family protein [Eilatimonas milleporae]